MDPLISVILPIRNNEQFLADCLESLLGQNYNNIEIIAIDDASNDNSPNILKEFRGKDKRIKIFRNIKKYGHAISLNRAIKKSKGKFISFMNPSDIVRANKFVKQITFLKQNPKVVAVGTQCIFIQPNGKQKGKSSYPAQSKDGISVLMESVIINRLAIPKDLLYFPAKKHLFLHSDMAVKLMAYGQLANLAEFLHLHRRRDKIASFEKQIFSLAKLWINSRFQHGISLPLRSLFANIKPTTS